VSLRKHIYIYVRTPTRTRTLTRTRTHTHTHTHTHNRSVVEEYERAMSQMIENSESKDLRSTLMEAEQAKQQVREDACLCDHV